MSYLSDEEYEAKIKADKSRQNKEARRQSRTPRGIEDTNRSKRNGNMSFGLTKDGSAFILEMTTNNSAARLFLELIQQLNPKMVQRFNIGDKGKQRIELTVRDPKRVMELAGIKPVPERCVKCDGYGSLDWQGKPTSSVLYWSDNKEGQLCPICKGTGRALPDPTEPDASEES